MKLIRKIIIGFFVTIIVAAVIVGFGAMMINSHVQNAEKDHIVCKITSAGQTLTADQAKQLKDQKPQCILVLGCGIIDSETPTAMLRDRMDTAIMLYKAGIAPKLLVSGDNGTVSHNEVHVMLKYAVDHGVPSEDVFCDHAGFSTYDSMYRANSIFQVKRMVVVTQTYHMYRSLYIARKLGLSAAGVSADQKTYHGQPAREMREVLARNKDFLKVIRKPEPTLGGEVIPITGSGEASHGE